MYHRGRDLSALARSVLEEIRRESSSEIARLDSRNASALPARLRVVGQP